MDFTLSQSQYEFRDEVRAFLRGDEIQSELAKIAEYAPREEPNPIEIYRALGKRRWLAPAWPVEYGGMGASLVESAIVAEELCWQGVPDIMHVVSVDIVGLFLSLAGTPEQKARFLPGIAAGEHTVCVLYSEPGVGSDLSGVRSRAERVDGGYRIYGTKLYSLRTAEADYGLCIARLDDAEPGGQDGLTLMLVPMSEPGLVVHPLYSIADERFGRVELDGVLVPDENVLGAPGDGWRLLTGALALERTGLESASKTRRWLDLLVERARENGRADDPEVAATLAELDIDVEAGRLLAWRVIGSLADGELDNTAASISKLYSSELAKRLVAAGVLIDGLDAALSRWSVDSPSGGFTDWLAREAPGVTISAGTSEIMRYVVASTGLKAV
jgi:alkylation response protein AidB-like acyl-CoA dehydrogenase